MSMHIKVPLVSCSEVDVLVDAGANEFFCAVEPLSWRRRFKYLNLSQRTGRANFPILAEFERAVRQAHRRGAKVHAAVNAFFYLPQQYKAAAGIIEDLCRSGADGIILADPVLLSVTRSSFGLRGKEVIIGCDAAVFNSSSVKFFRTLGATRIVFPREMTLAEMHAVIRQDTSLEYEAFIINDLCFFVDAFCAFCKDGLQGVRRKGRACRGLSVFEAADTFDRGSAGGCRTRFCSSRVDLRNGRKSREGNFSFWPRKHIEGCGACAVWGLERIGVRSLKVLDRNLSLSDRLRATRFVAQALAQSSLAASRADFQRSCRASFRRTFGVSCAPGTDCYYPDALEGAE